MPRQSELTAYVEFIGSEIHFALERMQMLDETAVDLVQARIGFALVAVVDDGIGDGFQCDGWHGFPLVVAGSGYIQW